MSIQRKFVRAFAALFFLISIALTIWFWTQRGHVGPPTISKTTTFIETPVDSAGYIDYVAAANELSAGNLKPEDNAAIDIIRAVGAIEQADVSEIWSRLDAPGAPPDRRILIPLENFTADLEIADDQHIDEIAQKSVDIFDRVTGSVWTAEDVPEGKAWLDANVESLKYVVDATRKPRFHIPYLVTDQDNCLVSATLPYSQETRSLARLLWARANLRMASNDIEGAQDDLIALRRLGLLLRNHRSLVECLIGIAITSMAYDGEARMIETANLDQQLIKRYQDLLFTLGKPEPLADTLNGFERYSILSGLQSIHRGELGAMGQKKPKKNSFDIDVAMTIANAFADRQNAIMQEPSFQLRQSKIAEFDNELQVLVRSVGPWSYFGRRQRGKLMANVMLSLMLPANSQNDNAVTRTQANLAMIETALRIEQFALETGQYPQALAEINAPNNGPARDPFSEKPLIYKRGEKGYRLYSVGKNLADDDGTRQHDDGKHQKDYDEVLDIKHQPLKDGK